MTIAVIGGGAAGLMAAGRLAELGAHPVIFEKMQRTALKLGITGKGRCNVTNDCDPQEFLRNVVSNPRFLYSAINRFPPRACMEFFEAQGVPLKTERGRRVFPASDHARDIVDALRRYAACRTVLHAPVTEICTENGAVTAVVAGGKRFDCDAALLCTGGMSYPRTGSDGSGYALAQALGHTVVPPCPSLVPVETAENWAAQLQGLSLRNVTLRVLDERDKTVCEDFGELLFTHFGLSGPLVLSASAHLREGGRYRFVIDLKPALDEQTLDNRLLSDFSHYANKDFANALTDLLPAKLIPVIVELSGIAPHKKVNTITREERRVLLTLLKHLTLTFRAFRPIDEAIVTRGGVSVKEVDPRTMESRLVRGLYFAGELLDLDAYTGGFNLQIAFATARLAAESAVQREPSSL